MFDIGKWFDEWKRKPFYEKYELGVDGILESMQVSFGEKSLKEWFEGFYPYYKETQNLKKLLNWFKIQKSIGTQDYHWHGAVSCLGEKRCLELLKLWWGEK